MSQESIKHAWPIKAPQIVLAHDGRRRVLLNHWVEQRLVSLQLLGIQTYFQRPGHLAYNEEAPISCLQRPQDSCFYERKHALGIKASSQQVGLRGGKHAQQTAGDQL